jgi:flagellar biosynthesis/type III secretory pathway M-ring protein FliF/YscJ
MLLRIVFVVALALMLVVPVYNLLKRRSTKIKKEMSDKNDLAQKLLEFKTTEKQLKKDCQEEIKAAEEQERNARKIQKQL